MSAEIGELTCSVAVEDLAASGQVTKRNVYRQAVLGLLRNEFRDIYIQAQLGKAIHKFHAKDPQMFTKFVKDGKTTIHLQSINKRLMLSNCPPDKLRIFVKALKTKLECLKHKGVVSERQKFLSEKARCFQEISPLTMKDIENVHNQRLAAASKDTGLFTPKGKRKRMGEGQDKENNVNKRFCNDTKSGPKSMKPRAALSVLSKEQQKVLQAVQSGQNVFFTGSAGTGKSFLLKRIIGALPPQHTFATASTGVAACHIGGTTLHAFAGIGSGKAPLEQCIALAQRPAVAQQWRRCKHLIIDEISMVDGEFFNKLETVARVVRKNDSVFGGIQLVLCGDFLQLPPVIKGNEKCKFAFQSRSWRHCVHMNLQLTEVRRQSDANFINILQQIRMGRCPDSVYEALAATSSHELDNHGIIATRLCTHKDDVDLINKLHLQKLTGPARVFTSWDSDEAYLQTINAQCPVKQSIELKQGAQVMLAKNLDVQRGLVNGARGVVVGFEAREHGLPIVQFMSGEKVTMSQERWTFKASGGHFLTRKQLPLKLAWAISIHKSQGMSLDCVEISLARVFEEGQAYVALSRARSLQGLRVLDFNKSCVRANPSVLKFYKLLGMSSSS